MKMKMSYGMFRVASGVPAVRLADAGSNAKAIMELIDRAEAEEVSLLVLPELCLTGATCGDLLSQRALLAAAETAAEAVRRHTVGKRTAVLLGAPVVLGGAVRNCALLLRGGLIEGIVPQGAGGPDGSRSVGSGVSGGPLNYAGCRTFVVRDRLFRVGEAVVTVEIGREMEAPVPPSAVFALAGARLVAGLGAAPALMGGRKRLADRLAAQSTRLHAACIYSGAGYGESVQDTVRAGDALIYEDGSLLAENEGFAVFPQLVIADVDLETLEAERRRCPEFGRFSRDCQIFPVSAGAAEAVPTGASGMVSAGVPAGIQSGEPSAGASSGIQSDEGIGRGTDFRRKLYRQPDCHPFLPKDEEGEDEALSIQVTGLASRLQHIGCRTALIGISGGLDSTLALLVAVLAADRLGWDRRRLIGVTMPGFGTSDRTHDNAVALMTALGISRKEISIVPAVTGHFRDIGQDPERRDVTYENAQARERTQILMDLANKEQGMVIGTGDLSELALGWATYGGDHISMYGVNAGVPKTLVRRLVRRLAREERFQSCRAVILDIAATPVSPELLPADGKADGQSDAQSDAQPGGTSGEKPAGQLTETLIGPYELHDFFLYQVCRYGFTPGKILFLAEKAFDGKEGRPKYGRAEIKTWLKVFYKRFFSQQFKRSCLPDGPKVCDVSLSPRTDWHMPSEARVEAFLQALDESGEE